MPVIQRPEHPAEDIEELTFAGLVCDFRPVGLILLFPVHMPQFKKRISVVERLPQEFKIPFRVSNNHGAVSPDLAAPLSPISIGKGLSSGRESRRQLCDELGAGKLDCVNFQRVPADKALQAGYGLWWLDAARTAPEQAQGKRQNTDHRNQDGEMDLRK